MKRRCFLLVLALLLAATFFSPPVYWRVVGGVNGEAFYLGRPTSWWERNVKAYSPQFDCGERFNYGWERNATPPWYASLLPKRLRPAAISGRLPLTEGDVAALPVLLELLQSKQAKARLVAVWGIGRLGEEAKSALSAVLEACEDSDDEVRAAARHARSEIEENQEQDSGE